MDPVRHLLHVTFSPFLLIPFGGVPCETIRSFRLAACLPLDRSSPHFDDQLNKALHGREYERCVQNLQRHDLIWLIDYLDDVSRYSAPSR